MSLKCSEDFLNLLKNSAAIKNKDMENLCEHVFFDSSNFKKKNLKSFFFLIDKRGLCSKELGSFLKCLWRYSKRSSEVEKRKAIAYYDISSGLSVSLLTTLVLASKGIKILKYSYDFSEKKLFEKFNLFKKREPESFHELVNVREYHPCFEKTVPFLDASYYARLFSCFIPVYNVVHYLFHVPSEKIAVTLKDFLIGEETFNSFGIIYKEKSSYMAFLNKKGTLNKLRLLEDNSAGEKGFSSNTVQENYVLVNAIIAGYRSDLLNEILACSSCGLFFENQNSIELCLESVRLSIGSEAIKKYIDNEG